MSLRALLGALALLFASPTARAVIIHPVSMQTACDGCLSPMDGSFELFVGVPAVSAAWVDDPSGPFEERSGLEFDLGSLGPGIIHSARLLLHVQSVIDTPTFEIHGYTGDGSVDLDDMLVSNLLFTSAPLTGPGDLDIELTSFVQSIPPNQTVGFMFRDIVFDSSVQFNFTDDVPTLRVDVEGAVAEPLAVALLLSAMPLLSRRIALSR
jgi:hypothetical protein